MAIGVTQWGREVHVTLGDLKLSCTPDKPSLRIAATVEREIGKNPDNCELRIWGLSAERRAELEQTPNLPFELKAGYTGAASGVFSGALRKGESIKQGAEWIFLATSGDGEDKSTQGKVSLSIKKGTALKDVLKQLVKACGYKPGNVAMLGIPFVSDLKLASGTDKLEKSISVYGSAVDELDWFCKSLGVVWSIQDGAFKGQRAGMPYDLLPNVLAEETGLIQPSPRFNDKGHCIVAALLIPELRPGMGFPIKSPKVTGSFIAAQTRHVIDTHGATDFRTEVRGVPYDGWGALLTDRFKL